MNRSGLGDETCVTPAIANYVTGLAVAREEFEMTCFSAVAELLQKTGVNPRRIRFLVTNSSLFNPTPSLGAMIMNKFKLGPNTQNFSLGGMGCSAGVIALDLAKQLLEHNPGEYCLVVSHENITNAHYKGRDRSMLVSNCIFRANGAAMLLSSRPADAGKAKYKLRHVVRTNLAADDQAYNCVFQMDDEEKKVCCVCVGGGGFTRHNLQRQPLPVYIAWLSRCPFTLKKPTPNTQSTPAVGREPGKDLMSVAAPPHLTHTQPPNTHTTHTVGCAPGQGPDERRRARAARQHDVARPPGAARQRADHIWRQPRAAQDGGAQQAARARGAGGVAAAVHAQVHKGV